MFNEVTGHAGGKIKISMSTFDLIDVPGLQIPLKKINQLTIAGNSKKKQQVLDGKWFIVDMSSFAYFHFIHSQIGQYELLKQVVPDLNMIMIIESQDMLDRLLQDNKKVIDDAMSLYEISEVIIYSNINYMFEGVYFYNARSRIIEQIDDSFVSIDIASQSDVDFEAYSLNIVNAIRDRLAPYISNKQGIKTYMLDSGKVSNQDEISRWAISKKYRVFQPAGSGLFSQINAASSSSVILSIHGANLTNIMFCNPGTHVIALNPYPNYLWFYTDIAEMLGIRMTVIDTPNAGIANTERLVGGN